MPGPDRRGVARAFGRAAAGYAAADFLHGAVRAGLIDRLEPVSLDPAVVLDLGAGPPEATADFAACFAKSSLIAIDLVPGMLGTGRQPWARVCADARRLPLPDASADLVVANLLLPWCEDASAVLREIRRVLKFPGLFAFSTLGPRSLHELREAWPQPDSATHTLDFPDMHNLGDALVRAGFAEPVVDTETIDVTYRELLRGIADLRSVGATNRHPERRRTLTGRRRWQAMISAYESRRGTDGALPVTLEVLYGHAWAGTAARRFVDPAGEISVPLHRVRQRR
ncbi:MAG: methyltransferase domain-containing protein [Gammaproteobacteria bacterium]|nr:methyltransferase domain-containing protein [Gammaproteobacteria bacterium]